MKKITLLGGLLLGLTACGGGSTPSDYPYNPNASTVQSNDARIPYRGDWQFVAILDDKSKRYGVIAITDKASTADLKNAGGGRVAWCLRSDCTQDEEQGVGVIGSATVEGKAFLSIGMTPNGGTKLRFFLTDTDGVVETKDGKATILGEGTWTNPGGGAHAANFAFVQINTKSDLASQAAKQQAFLSAQELLAARAPAPQEIRPQGEIRDALTSSLIK
ncbi:hypothetical protein DAERI_100063 [Deinococcus aerius]|uniref:Lipoprotein n=1 Tax=Deinococcus aerius TaxID=200253 RepID=A0A2I9D840_9DEIO|nr:hypothetical protein [Deinococcus aerius]GBF06700.1 hypothetical protein DAERI_100063 [Deinococcus aerius]